MTIIANYNPIIPERYNIGYRHNEHRMTHTNDNYRDRLCSNTWRIITSHIGSATTMSIVLVSASLLSPIITMSSQAALAQRLLLSTQQPIVSNNIPIVSNNNLRSLQQQQLQLQQQQLQQQQLQLPHQQAALAQRLLQLSSQPTLIPSINSINNNNNILSALKQVPGTNIIVPSSTSPSGSSTTTTPSFPHSSTTTAAAAAAATNTRGSVATIVTGQGAAAGLDPFVSTSNQIPFIQGISTNGFTSLPQCASNAGSFILQTPNSDPSALIFQVFSSPSNSINQIPDTRTTISTNTINNVNTATLLPLVGSFTISNSLGVPSIAGQINTGHVSGNTFSLQGTLAGSNTIAANALSGGLSSSSLCSSTAFSSNPLFPTTTTSTITSNTGINDFAITGTCGTNVPVTFAIDRVVVGEYSANILCNNIA